VIPRHVSFFWSGRMSWLRYMTLRSFRTMNPGWGMTLFIPEMPCGGRTWHSPENDDSRYSGTDWTEHVRDLGVDVVVWECPVPSAAPAQASDLLAWDVLGSEGGFCCDMDVLWVSSMEDLWMHHLEDDALICLEDGLLAVGLLASRPKCPLFRDVLASVGESSEYQGYGTTLLYRFSGLKARKRGDLRPDGEIAVQLLRDKYPELRIVELPQQTVYPFDWRETHNIFESSKLLPVRTLGVHWFGGDPVSNRWNMMLTEDNWQDHHNTLTDCLKRVLA
jgi:hypothetical protein